MRRFTMLTLAFTMIGLAAAAAEQRPWRLTAELSLGMHPGLLDSGAQALYPPLPGYESIAVPADVVESPSASSSYDYAYFLNGFTGYTVGVSRSLGARWRIGVQAQWFAYAPTLVINPESRQAEYRFSPSADFTVTPLVSWTALARRSVRLELSAGPHFGTLGVDGVAWPSDDEPPPEAAAMPTRGAIATVDIVVLPTRLIGGTLSVGAGTTRLVPVFPLSELRRHRQGFVIVEAGVSVNVGRITRTE